jgi:alkylhydroperoxidase/carboxymuconolactone decarboxylase family protein YurZ
VEEGDVTSNYLERLRQVSVTGTDAAGAEFGGESGTVDDGIKLDARTLALARLAALVAVGGPAPSFDRHADAALSAGASADEIVDVLIGVSRIVGLPRVIAAAPRLALALGHDLEGDGSA